MLGYSTVTLEVPAFLDERLENASFTVIISPIWIDMVLPKKQSEIRQNSIKIVRMESIPSDSKG